MNPIRLGGRWLFTLLILFGGIGHLYAQSSNDNFLATLGELREATFSDRESIVDRLSQSGHSSVRAVLTAFLEDRLYFRNDDQQIFIVRTTEGDLPAFDLIDLLSLESAGSSLIESLTKIGTNNRL